MGRLTRTHQAPLRALCCCIGLLGLVGGGCKEVTEKVVQKSVKLAKDTTKGIEQGIEQGRKEGESADGALVISRPDELVGKGAITVRALRPQTGNPKHAEVELSIENSSDRPLRLTGFDAMALDKESFTQRPTASAPDVTVPARAKERLVLAFDTEPAALKKLRIWGVDHALPAPTAVAQ